MVLSRKKSTVNALTKMRVSQLSSLSSPPNTPNSRKRASETPSMRTKKLKVEYEQIFNEFKKAHDSEVSSIVLSMGSGDAGQLGLGDEYLEKKRPCVINGLTEIVKIRAGGMHNICLSKDGKVFTFGCNDDMALGRVTVEDEESMVPGLVKIPSDSKVIDVTAGDSHSAVLTASGHVFIWGSFRDNNGIIGLLKPFERVAEPIEVPSIDGIDQKIVKIASGENHFVMLTDRGDILTFGCAEQGQLGRVREVYLNRGGKSGLSILLTPHSMRVRSNLRFSDIWAGANCTVARAADGELYGCGLNNYGQLGLAEEDRSMLTVLLLTPMKQFNERSLDWRCVAFGQHHTVAMTTAGQAFVIGRGDYGSLGLGDSESRDSLCELTIDAGIDSVSACSHVSYLLTKTGKAMSWGCGNTYQLGHGDGDDDVNVPTTVIGRVVKDMRVLEVSVGGQHVLFRAVPIPIDTAEAVKETIVEEETAMVTDAPVETTAQENVEAMQH